MTNGRADRPALRRWRREHLGAGASSRATRGSPHHAGERFHLWSRLGANECIGEGITDLSCPSVHLCVGTQAGGVEISSLALDPAVGTSDRHPLARAHPEQVDLELGTVSRWSVDLAAVSNLPESVREVIEPRIDRLGDDGRETLTIAAVIGRSFDVALLSELVEIPESRLLDHLETAVSATLLRESTDQVGRFTFEHALINHTLYQGLGATRRARLHHCVAVARALKLDDDPDRRALLLSLQAIELIYEHDPRRRRARAEQALALAREIGQPRTTARVLNDYCFAFYTADGLEQRLAHLDEMAAAVEAAEDPAIEFWTLCREHDMMAESGQFERVAKAAERMAATAERVGDPTMRHDVAFSSSACMALLRGDLAAAERGAAQALQIGSDAGDPDAAMLFGAQIMYVRLLQGRSTEIVDQLEQSVLANPLIPAFKGLLAYTLCWLDRRGEAARLVAQAAEDRFEHIPRDSSRMIALGLFADAAAQAGVRSAAEILYELVEPWPDQVTWNGVVAEGHIRTYLGLLAATLGRDGQADEHFARAIEIQERDGMLVWTARAHLGWAEALVARGRTELAREHATRALEPSREHGYGAFEPRAAAIVASGAAIQR